MKNIIFLSVFQITLISTYAQEPLSFEKVIKADSIDKNTLFASINDWFASSYNSSDDVLKMVDKEAGIIIGKGNFDFLNTTKSRFSCYHGYIKYTLKVYVKDNRYKVVIGDFIHFAGPDKPAMCNLGTITDLDVYATSGMAKKYLDFQNEAWSNSKLAAEVYSLEIFNILEEKTSNTGLALVSDNW